MFVSPNWQTNEKSPHSLHFHLQDFTKYQFHQWAKQAAFGTLAPFPTAQNTSCQHTMNGHLVAVRKAHRGTSNNPASQIGSDVIGFAVGMTQPCQRRFFTRGSNTIPTRQPNDGLKVQADMEGFHRFKLAAQTESRMSINNQKSPQEKLRVLKGGNGEEKTQNAK